MNKPNLNPPGASPEPSRVDLFSGRHTTSLIVGILIALVFITFVLVIIFKEKLPEHFITGTFGLLGVLAGFFATSLSKAND